MEIQYEMDDEQSLRNEIERRLRENGTLDRIQAELRSAIYLAINHEDTEEHGRNRIETNLDEGLTFSIIYHYLQQNRFLASAAVFEKECRHKILPFDAISASINGNRERIAQIAQNIAHFVDYNSRDCTSSKTHSLESNLTEKLLENGAKLGRSELIENTEYSNSSTKSMPAKLETPVAQLKGNGATKSKFNKEANKPFFSSIPEENDKPMKERFVISPKRLDSIKSTASSETIGLRKDSKIYDSRFPFPKISQMHSNVMEKSEPSQANSASSNSTSTASQSSGENSASKFRADFSTPSENGRKSQMQVELQQLHTISYPKRGYMTSFDIADHSNSTSEENEIEDIAVDELLQSDNSSGNKSISF